MNLNRRLPFLLAALLGATAHAPAQTAYYWVGRDTSPTFFGAYWSYNNNFSTSSGGSGLGSALPSAQNYLNFDGNAVGTQLTTNDNYNAAFQIYFKSGAPNYTLSGNPLTFFDVSGTDPNIQNEGASSPVINLTVTNGNNNGTFRVLYINRNAGTKGPLTFNGNILGGASDANARALNVDGGPVIFNGSIRDGAGGGALGLTTVGGTITLAGSVANTYSGLTTINGGTVVLNKTAGVNAIPANVTLGDGTGGDVLQLVQNDQIADTSVITFVGNTVGNRGWLQLNSRSDTIGGISSSAAGHGLVANEGTTDSTLTLSNTTTQTFSGLIRNGNATAGKLALVKTGAGSQVISGANTYTGGTTLNAGTLNVQNATALGTGSLVLNGGNLDSSGIVMTANNPQNWNGDFAFTGTANLDLGTGAVALNATRQVTVVSNTLTVGGVISGSGFGLTKAGGGTLVLSGASTFTGPLTLINNTGVPLGGGNSIGAVVLSNTLATTSVRIGNYSLGGTGLNAFSTLQLGVNNALPSTVSLNFDCLGGANFSYLKLMGNTLTVAGLSSTDSNIGATPGAIIQNTGTETGIGNGTLIVSNTADQVFSGRFRNTPGGGSGTLALVKTGPAKLTLTGYLQELGGGITVSNGTLEISGSTAHVYTGGLNLRAGQLNLNYNTALGAAASALNIFGGTLDNTTGGALTIANNNPQNWNGDFTFAGSSSLNLGTGAVTLNASRQVTINANTLTVGGIISGTGFGLTKTGAGTLALGGANAYTGSTVVNAGTLVVNSSLAAGSTVTNLAGAILGGAGTINGPVGVGGILAPGAGAAAAGTTLTLAGNVTLDSACVVSNRINKTGLTLTADKVNKSGGTLTLAGTLRVVASGNALAANDTFDLFDGTLAGSFSSVILPSLSGGLTWDTSALAAGSNGTIRVVSACSGTLAASAVATPNPVALGGTLTLSASATGGSGTYANYSWTGPNGFATNAQSPTIAGVTGAAAGNYTVTVTDSLGCTAVAVVKANVTTLAVFGSSVAQGWNGGGGFTNGSYVNGYAGLLTAYLATNGVFVTNVATPGDTTSNGLVRFPTKVVPVSPNYVLLAFGLNNEGLAGSADPAGVVARFTSNLTNLIFQCRTNGYYPILGSGYPDTNYSATEYGFLKSANLTINSWDVPSINLLGTVDAGNGRYVPNYNSDSVHPNTAGHQEFFYAIVPSLIDAIAQGRTNRPTLATTNYARLQQTAGVTAPLVYDASNTIHSFTVAFRVRSANSGTIATIRSGGSHATLQITNGQFVYYGLNGSQIAAGAINATNGGWFDIALANRYAQTNTVLMVDGSVIGNLTEQFVPDQFVLGGPAGSGAPATPAVVDFQNWCVYRSAWNADEASAQAQGNLQQASMEIGAMLGEASFTSNSPALNRAQSLSQAIVKSANFTAQISLAAPSGLTASPLAGAQIGTSLAWSDNSTGESGFLIQRRLSSSGSWSDIATVAANTTSYSDSGLSSGVSYDYRIVVLEGSGLRGRVSNVATIVTGFGSHQVILVDFGPNDGSNGVVTASPDYLGQTWNNFVGTGNGVGLGALSLTNLVTTSNATTAIGLNSGASGWAANGILNGGLLAPSQALLGNFAVTNATSDYFLTTTSGTLTLTNLDATRTYRLRLFGSRNTTETRVTRFSVTGGNGTFTNDLTTSGTGIGAGGYNGNNNTITTISGVAPDGGAQIQITVTRLTGSFAHLGILELLANRVPTARAVTNTVDQFGSVTVTNNPGKNALVTDADGDALTFAVLTQPTNGTATAAANGITYVNTGGGAGQFDTLTYAVSDGFGGVATNTMRFWVQSAIGFNLVSQSNTVTHAFLTYAGVVGQSYVAERATNLTASTVWVPLATNTANPLVTFTNAFDPNSMINFFRARPLP